MSSDDRNEGIFYSFEFVVLDVFANVDYFPTALVTLWQSVPVLVSHPGLLGDFKTSYQGELILEP